MQINLFSKGPFSQWYAGLHVIAVNTIKVYRKLESVAIYDHLKKYLTRF